jgi:demethylmenaquinone methyltransferase/2-methoxy-6-polyprenyl-1,4-benzoquinol methylase
MNTLARYYAKRAPEYERIYRKPERQQDLQKLRDFVARAFTGRRVLEVACGTGWWTGFLAEAARSVVATDLNEEVLALARAKSMGPGKVFFELCDAFELNQIQRDFDAGFAAFWWSHLAPADLQRFLCGFHAVLQPGSIILFIDNIFVEGSSTPIWRRDEEGNTYQLRRLDDGTTTEVLKNFPRDEDIVAALGERARELVIHRLKHYWIAQYRL